MATTFVIGENVETLIVFNKRGGRKGSEHWIDATITGYNQEDGTYNINVLDAKKHRVNPAAIHVPASFLRKKSKSEDLMTIIAMGFPEAVAMQYLNMADGNLDLALSCLYDEQQANLPDQNSGRKQFRRQVSSVYVNGNQTLDPLLRPQTLREAPPARTGLRSATPKADEFDFTVTWTMPTLGFELRPARNNKNAMVGARTSVFANENVFQGSLLLEVGDTWVVGKHIDEIRALCSLAVEKLPDIPITFRFRGKTWMKQEFKERGTLKILIVAGQGMYKPSTHVTVRVNDALLSTNRVSKDSDPLWEEVMMWRSFRTDHNKHAVIRVWQYNRFTANVCVGRAKLKLPTEFDKCVNSTLEVKDDKGGMRGILIVRTMIQRNRRYY